MSNSFWLILSYRIPTEPSRLRAGVWRRLKSLGAVYLQNAVAVLPGSAESERALRLLRNDIEEMGGSAQLLRAETLAGEDELVAAFNAARDDEYAELLARCEAFLEEIEAETAAQHFSYAELEENDEDLSKLRGWLSKISARDTFGAARADETVAAVERCAIALDGFAARVYAHETAPAGDS